MRPTTTRSSCCFGLRADAAGRRSLAALSPVSVESRIGKGGRNARMLLPATRRSRGSNPSYEGQTMSGSERPPKRAAQPKTKRDAPRAQTVRYLYRRIPALQFAPAHNPHGAAPGRPPQEEGLTFSLSRSLAEKNAAFRKPRLRQIAEAGFVHRQHGGFPPASALPEHLCRARAPAGDSLRGTARARQGSPEDA